MLPFFESVVRDHSKDHAVTVAANCSDTLTTGRTPLSWTSLGGGLDSFDPPAAPHAFLERMHVHDGFGGNGVGTQLLHAYVAEAASRGCAFVGGQLDLTSETTSAGSTSNAAVSQRDLDNFGARPDELRIW